ncbi:hypothetical protein BDV95DRAFT_63232 [Massariosphaeria phaeospora]|uniref:BZIP domain-containing protein n=1 Tax=Massariosphaeria phaeospora TaxID=100035 RepID=A0A7C8M8D2_9PLEO|nr:hypothetical protein BDV95DRAFT_63232 [Massariosphaeria phaeospora]
MESFSSRQEDGHKLDWGMAAEVAAGVSTLFGGNQGVNYLGLRIPNLPLSNGQAAFSTATKRSMYASTTNDIPNGSATSLSPFQPMFTASNATQTACPPPVRMSFGRELSDLTNPTNGNGWQLSLSPRMSHSSATSTEPPSRKRSLDEMIEDSSTIKPNSGQSSATRRRLSEPVEGPSARSVYLEKNRKAASKCRNKQKKQQEDLVEKARDGERRNKVLKAERELLRMTVRELMEIVATHSQCPDDRLKRYVQREANRLARGDLATRTVHDEKTS